MESLSKELVMKLWKELKRYPFVVGIDGDLKPRVRNGEVIHDEKCLVVYVSRKIPRAQFKELSFTQKIRAFFKKKNPMLLSTKDLLPKELNGYPIDVVEIGRIVAKEDNISAVRPLPRKKRGTTKKFRPLMAGISATHYHSTACTLNGVFRKKDKLLLASNMHCFGQENTAKKGDPILQPSPYDGGTIADQIGEYSFGVNIIFDEYQCPYRNFFHKLSKFFRKKEFNTVDISFATFKCDYCPVCEPEKIGCGMAVYTIGLPSGKREAILGEDVVKVGRTTGKTIGKVVSTNWTGKVEYSRGVATFTDCILVEGRGFSAGGDSGSPVLGFRDKAYLGALFAGSDTHTVVCKVSNIEKEAGVEYFIPAIKVRKRG